MVPLRHLPTDVRRVVGHDSLKREARIGWQYSRRCKEGGNLQRGGIELLLSGFTDNEQTPADIASAKAGSEVDGYDASSPLPVVVNLLCEVVLTRAAGRGHDWHFINPFGVAGFEEFNGGGVVGDQVGFHGVYILS